MAVEFVRSGDIGVITLNDDAVKNALTQETLGAILEYLRRADTAGFVIASSLRVFCAGADIRELAREDLSARRLTPVDLFAAIYDAERPVVAALAAGAYGGGAELCLACDAIVAGPRGFLTFPEIGIGVFPSTAAYLLPSMVGRTRALEWMTGRRRIGAEALHLAGIVAELVAEDASVVDAAAAYVSAMTRDAAPSALLELRRIAKPPIPWTQVRSAIERVDSEERIEGSRAFKERRPPNFKRSRG